MPIRITWGVLNIADPRPVESVSLRVSGCHYFVNSPGDSNEDAGLKALDKWINSGSQP